MLFGRAFDIRRAMSKKVRFNIMLIVIVCLLYLFNNQVLKKCTEGLAREFVISYFNDLICPVFFCSYVNVLLSFIKQEICKLKWLVLLVLGAGLIWEFFAPLLKPSSVTDIMDLLCYIVGTVFYWFLLKIFQKERNR